MISLSPLLGGLLVWVVYWFLGKLEIPEPVRTILNVVVAIIAVVWLAGLFGIRF